MVRLFRSVIGSWCLVALGCRAVAQAPGDVGRVEVQIDTDLRARAAGRGRSRSELYATSAHIGASLAPGWRVDALGTDKYGLFRPQEAVVEHDVGSGRVRGGLIRLPFGIHDSREVYASGLIDYPMPRVDYGHTSLDWGVPGIEFEGGGPRLQLEAALFEGRASGVWSNRNNVGGAALRAQTFVGGIILGVSRWDGYFDTDFGTNVRNPVRINGLDFRYTRPHLLLRGEYLVGQMGRSMHGGYLDFYYHLPKFARWTLTTRIEGLRPNSSDSWATQWTLGVRFTATPRWILTVNWRCNNSGSAYPYSWTPGTGAHGDWLFQAYHKILL